MFGISFWSTQSIQSFHKTLWSPPPANRCMNILGISCRLQSESQRFTVTATHNLPLRTSLLILTVLCIVRFEGLHHLLTLKGSLASTSNHSKYSLQRLLLFLKAFLDDFYFFCQMWMFWWLLLSHEKLISSPSY